MCVSVALSMMMINNHLPELELVDICDAKNHVGTLSWTRSCNLIVARRRHHQSLLLSVDATHAHACAHTNIIISFFHEKPLKNLKIATEFVVRIYLRPAQASSILNSLRHVE